MHSLINGIRANIVDPDGTEQGQQLYPSQKSLSPAKVMSKF